MASEIKKPQGITEIWLADVPEKLWPLPASAMYGIGRKTAARLASLGLQSIGDLAGVEESFLIGLLGKFGHEIYRHARGIDDDPVLAPAEDSMKSIGRSTTLPQDIDTMDAAGQVLMELADEVGCSARKHGRKGHTVQITLKFADFQVITRQMSLPPTAATQDIYHAGRKLLEQHWNPAKPIRLLGISLSGFQEEAAARQLSLFDMPEAAVSSEKLERLDQAMDKIRARMGKDSVTRAKLIKKANDPPDPKTKR